MSEVFLPLVTSTLQPPIGPCTSSVRISEKKGPDSFFPVYSCQFHHNQIFIPSTDVIQLTLTLTMTTAEVVEVSVTINNSPIQDYAHPDDHEKKILKTLGGPVRERE